MNIEIMNEAVCLHCGTEGSHYCEAAPKVISMMPQLLCKQLAQDLGRFLDNQPGASPKEMLAQCDHIMTEIGAVSDGNGGWILPDEEPCS